MTHPFEMTSDQPHLFFTADYELFLGSRSGTPEACLLIPTEKLAGLLEEFGRKLILFVDVMYLWRLHQQAPIKQIHTQLQNLLRRGHHLQLHLHPQWLDARKNGEGWEFSSYSHYALPDLSSKPDPAAWETILGCLIQGRKWLQDFCREIIPQYEINCFRAGGLCLQPFKKVSSAFKEAGIRIDSSVAPGLCAENGVRRYDFAGCPEKDSWRFDEDFCQERPNGSLLEMPVMTFKARPLDKGRTFFARWKTSGEDRKTWGDGRGVPGNTKSWRKRLSTTRALLTYDYWEADTMIKVLSQRVQEGYRALTLLGHPKFLSPFGLAQIQKVLCFAQSEGWK